MLEVGNGGMTNVEYQTHFAMWAFLKAPLIIGTDITQMSNETFTILTNSEIIAINQDKLGASVSRVWTDSTGNLQIWAGPIVGGVAAIFYNAGNSTANITGDFSIMNVGGLVKVRDLINHQDLGNFNKSITLTVVSHGCAALKITPAQVEEEEEESSIEELIF